MIHQGFNLAADWSQCSPFTPHDTHAGEVLEKAGKAFTDTGKVGKKFNPDHPEGTVGKRQICITQLSNTQATVSINFS